MADTKSFQCPNCGSPITTSGLEKEVKCAYCGSTVIVPEELRIHVPYAEINYAQMPRVDDEVLQTVGTVGKAVAGVTVGVTAISVILPIVLTCIILGAVGIILYSVFSGVGASTRTTIFPTSIPEVVTRVPTPVNTPTVFSKVLLQDDFTDPASDWDKMRDSNYTLEYANGRYHAKIDKTDGGQVIWLGDKYADASIEVDVQQTAGPDDAQVGIACRTSDAGGLYSFEFSQDGSYGIYKYTNWNSDLMEMGKIDPTVIHRNKINHLEAVCDRENLTLVLNGRPVLQVHDSQYTVGGVGLVVRTGGSGEAGIDMLFSNFLVKGP